MSGVSKNDWKGLWAILWRTLILAPILWILGLVLLSLVLAVLILPPFYVVLAFFVGDWLLGILTLIGWLVVLRFSRPMLRWTLEGIEYGGI